MTITVLRSILIYIFVVTAVRIMGKRQIGELKPHELVITILISSVATVPLQENSIPLANTVLPIMVFVSFEIIESALSMKSFKFRDFVQGKPIIIIKDGKLQQNAMTKLRFTMDDLIDALRQENVFDINDVENAVVETNGSLSVQLKAEKSPITPEQMNLQVEKVQMPIAIVIDTKPVNEYFGDNKIKDSEIELYLKSNSIDINNVMMLTVDENGKLFLINKENSK